MNFDISKAASMNAVERDGSRVASQALMLRDISFHNKPVPVNQIGVIPGHNNRSTFDEDKLASLGRDIEQKGLLQPLIVIEVDATIRELCGFDDSIKFALIAGERRYRAIKEFTSLDTVPDAKIYTPGAWVWRQSMMMTENAQREDVTLLETVKKVGDVIEAEWSRFDHPEREFIKSDTLPAHISRAAVAISKAMKASSDFEAFVTDSGIQNYRALKEWADAINDEGLSKQRRERLHKWTSMLRKNELEFKNFAKLAKDVKSYTAGDKKAGDIEKQTQPSGKVGDGQQAEQGDVVKKTKPSITDKDIDRMIKKLLDAVNDASPVVEVSIENIERLISTATLLKDKI